MDDSFARLLMLVRMHPDNPFQESFRMIDPAAMSLHICPTGGGRWTGRLFIGSREVGHIEPGATPAAVEDAARKTGLPLDHVRFEPAASE